MEYAVIKTGGKQYLVKTGETIAIEKVAGDANSAFVFDQVLLHVVGDKVSVGNPTVKGLTVSGTILLQGKGEKIRVAKFKAKSRYRRVTGHRQHLTTVKIDSIGNLKPAPKAKK